jgi:hypothetical protein
MSGAASWNGMVWPVGTGWCGQSEGVGEASHSRLASADLLLLPRDVRGDAVEVTSVWGRSLRKG